MRKKNYNNSWTTSRVIISKIRTVAHIAPVNIPVKIPGSDPLSGSPLNSDHLLLFTYETPPKISQ